VIRNSRPGDEERAYEICLRTGNAGQGAADLYADPSLMGHLFVGQYLALAPDLAFMLVDDRTSTVDGYIVGVADTASFAELCEREWWPSLRRRYPRDNRPARDEELVEAIHRPWLPPQTVLADYPAHLHINLLPVAQGAGLGRVMVETLLSALRDAGAAGVHLGVRERNVRAIRFYERLGFTTLDTNTHGRLMGRFLS